MDITTISVSKELKTKLDIIKSLLKLSSMGAVIEALIEKDESLSNDVNALLDKYTSA